jgi:hypothetical protein
VVRVSVVPREVASALRPVPRITTTQSFRNERDTVRTVGNGRSVFSSRAHTLHPSILRDGGAATPGYSHKEISMCYTACTVQPGTAMTVKEMGAATAMWRPFLLLDTHHGQSALVAHRST